MKKQKKGMHVGHLYLKFRPVTVVLLCVIVLALAAGAVYLMRDSIFGGNNDTTVKADGGAAVQATTGAPDMAIVTNTPTPVPPTPSPEPTAEPTPEPTPAPRSATIRFIGEIAADENILSAAMQDDGSYSFADMLSMASGAVGNADYTIANVEGSMGGIGSGYTGKKLYNTPEILISELKAIGVDMLTLANDHALDAGMNGLLGTITHCQEAGMEYVGGASTQEEHDTPKIIDINGIGVCFLNYTTTLNSMEKETTEDAVRYGVNLAKYSDSRADAAAAREAGADVIIAVISWSEDGATKIDDVQKQVAQILLDSGVDVIIGYGSRNAQAVLWLDTTDEEGNVTDSILCVCSVGTFLSSSTEDNMDFGTVFEFTLAEQPDGAFKVENPVSIPTYVWQYADGEDTGYRVLACGEWLEEQPEGMTDEAYVRMQTIWDNLPAVVTEASTVEMN